MLRLRPRRLLFAGSGILLGLLLSEIALSVLAALSPCVEFFLRPPWDRHTIEDPELGYRPHPCYPGLDDWGFRNERVPESSEILTLGDSFTFGYSVQAGSDWPRLLAKQSGKQVYNMAYGGYGPCEYLGLLEQALTLEPHTVIVGLYLSNDVSDSYKAVYMQSRFQRFRSEDPKLLASIEAADSVATLEELSRDYQGFPRKDRPESPSLKLWLSEHSSLYGLLRGICFELDPSRYKSPHHEVRLDQDQFEIAAGRFGRYVIYGDIRAVIMPPRAIRIRSDLDDPRIREGFRIATAALLEIAEKLRSKRVRLLVALIPSKPVVYEELIEKSEGKDKPVLLDVIHNEEELALGMKRFFEERRIPFVDTLPELAQALRNGMAPFSESDDEHANAAGYAAIARGVLRGLAVLK